ncbi:MAG: arylamine N-acetyltransferase [Melioribacteraceae bacterium]
MNISAYLERINYRGELVPTIETLGALQLAHLRAIPFENLSIHENEPIVLQEESLFDKIVTRKRGGFCYELNGLFASLLRELGFNVAMLSAGVAKDVGGFGPDFDHMTLMISLNERWLVDVGFGDSFQQPLLIDRRDVQSQGEHSYQMDDDGNYLILKEKRKESEWKSQYRFTLYACGLSDYEEMCRYHQTSPQSTFTQKRLCSLAKPNGRITLSDMRLIETIGNEKQERILSDESEYTVTLEKEFGIIL